MGAPKGNQNAKGSRGGTGRPTKYRVEYVKAVEKMAERGWTEIEMAEALNVDVLTFRRWKLRYVDFMRAATPSDEQCLLAVKRALFSRATGYSHKAVKIMTVSLGGTMGSEVTREEYVEHYPPDVAAIQFFLKNRDPERWKDKQEVDQRTDAVVRVEGGLPDKEPEAK